MKKSITLCALMLVAGMALAQGKKKIDVRSVPKSAQNSFKAKYPGAKVDFWEQEGNDYEVMFNWKGTEYEAVFNTEGEWIETETWITEKELPAEVMAALQRSHLENWKIERIEKVSVGDDEEFYEIDLKNGEETTEIYYDHNGELLADDRWDDEDLGEEIEVDED